MQDENEGVGVTEKCGLEECEICERERARQKRDREGLILLACVAAFFIGLFVFGMLMSGCGSSCLHWTSRAGFISECLEHQPYEVCVHNADKMGCKP